MFGITQAIKNVKNANRLSKKPLKMTGYTSVSRITDFNLIKPSLRKKVEVK